MRISTVLFMSSQQPTISEDLFFNILWFFGASHTDLMFLWTTCREVSREFKYAVERLFIAKHLGRTYLRIDAGMNVLFFSTPLKNYLIVRTAPSHCRRAIFSWSRVLFCTPRPNQSFTSGISGTRELPSRVYTSTQAAVFFDIQTR
jgi:hypothetical protein